MPEPIPSQPLVEVRDLRIQLRSRDGARLLNVVNGVMLSASSGQNSASSVSRAAASRRQRLLSWAFLPGSARITGGQVSIRRREFADQVRGRKCAPLRGAKISMIFQDPMVALDPLFTVGDQLAEPLKRHLRLSGEALRERQVSLLQAVIIIPSPESASGSVPTPNERRHVAAGGGAIAIACNPALLIADEPTTALDPTAQAQFLDLLARLRDTHQLALIVVTQTFGVTARLSMTCW